MSGLADAKMDRVEQLLRGAGIDEADDLPEQRAGVVPRKQVGRKPEDHRHPDYRRRPVFQTAARRRLRSHSFNCFNHYLTAHEIVSLAHSAAPINPALLPNCAWTTSTLSESTRKTRARIERRIGSRISSPAAATPPPITIRRGVTAVITLAMPAPMTLPANS